MDQLTLIGKSYKISDGKLDFVYLAGDMTKAYDSESVDEVTRHMLAIMTSDEKFPLVFATYDRVTSKDPSYKKIVLLHSMTPPVVSDDGFITVTNTKDGNSGKLVKSRRGIGSGLSVSESLLINSLKKSVKTALYLVNDIVDRNEGLLAVVTSYDNALVFIFAGSDNTAAVFEAFEAAAIK
jgi:hypothetical protein